ncbi:MAG: SurA N-terminal domain-containing protein, partial [Nitrospira sp.]
MNDQSLFAYTCLHARRLFSTLKGTSFAAPVRSATGVTTGALCFCLCVLFSPTSKADAAKLEDRIVAVVNSDLIMLSELKRDLLPEQDRLRKLYKGDDLERRLSTAEAMGVTKMIERKLQLQAAKNKGVDVSDQEVVQAVEEMKKQGEAIDSADPNT